MIVFGRLFETIQGCYFFSMFMSVLIFCDDFNQKTMFCKRILWDTKDNFVFVSVVCVEYEPNGNRTSYKSKFITTKIRHTLCSA